VDATTQSAEPAGALSTPGRERTLDRLEREAFDCVVVGGGITGAGIAREAARRGLRVAVLEAVDFAVGTSSRSSKLIHGGLRYLAMGDVRLVRETALERKEIFRLAPHLAERRWMVVPTRSRAGLMKLRVAISTYEKLGAVEAEDAHQNWGAEELEREEPALDRAQHAFACAYREYLTDDARLVLAALRGAAADGAALLNHVRVDRILQENGRACGVEAECALSGRRVRVRARAVVNAAGPWVEALRALEDPGAQPLLHLSKGIHVVLPAERLPVRNMVVVGTQDARSMFVIRRGPVVYAGTTDTSYSRGAELWPEVTTADVEYVLEPLPRYFTTDPVKVEECVAAWAGLRPLVAEPGKSPSEISRRDEILIGAAGVVTIAGGKLTGYRPMARRAVDTLCELLGVVPHDPGPEPALPGGAFDGDLDALASRLAKECALPERAAWRLARLYGSEAAAVAACASGALAAGAEEVRAGEVDWAVRQEGAATLEDFLYRRARVAWYDPAVRSAVVEPAARRMAAMLGWDEARVASQVAAVRERMAQERSFSGQSS
jgi:glycerol-3-phosphate dehydrogenase